MFCTLLCLFLVQPSIGMRTQVVSAINGLSGDHAGTTEDSPRSTEDSPRSFDEEEIFLDSGSSFGFREDDESPSPLTKHDPEWYATFHDLYHISHEHVRSILEQEDLSRKYSGLTANVDDVTFGVYNTMLNDLKAVIPNNQRLPKLYYDQKYQRPSQIYAGFFDSSREYSNLVTYQQVLNYYGVGFKDLGPRDLYDLLEVAIMKGDTIHPYNAEYGTLFTAEVEERVDLVKEILQAGVNVNLYDSELIEILDPEVTGGSRFNLVSVAVLSGHKRVTEMLLEAGAKSVRLNREFGRYRRLFASRGISTEIEDCFKIVNMFSNRSK